MKDAKHPRGTERRRFGVAIVPEAVARSNPDIVVREIEVDVKRQVGLAYSSARPASDVLQDFIAKLEKQHPAARRGKRAATSTRR